MLGQFVDGKGRQWRPEVNVWTIKRVRECLGYNLIEMLVPKNTLIEKLSDPCAMVDVLYVICEDRARAASVTDEQFGRDMTPEAIEDGWAIVLQGIVNFSPSGVRPAHQKVLDKATALEKVQAERLKTLVASKEFEETLDKAMNRHLQALEISPTSGSGDVSSLPESPESSPGNIP